MKHPAPLLLPLLIPLAWLYSWISSLRRLLYKNGVFSSFRLPGIVISIGNIEAGGTGKSPITMALCEELQRQGAHPVVLTRGYRSGLAANDSAVLLGTELLLAPKQNREFVADEARMQAARLQTVPIIIGSDRWQAAQRYLQHHPAPTHWLLDDGFQHLRLQRDADIVLLDARQPFGNGRCLPAGLLREQASSLRNADWIIFTRAESSHASLYNKPCSSIKFISGDPYPLKASSPDWQKISTWLLALGIARPDRLYEELTKKSLPVSRILTFADHQNFQKDALAEAMKECEALLTTEKDYWRDKSYFDSLDHPVYLIPLSLSWQGEDSFAKILEVLTKNLHTKN